MKTRFLLRIKQGKLLQIWIERTYPDHINMTDFTVSVAYNGEGINQAEFFEISRVQFEDFFERLVDTSQLINELMDEIK
jgi:hypothetical protein